MHVAVGYERPHIVFHSPPCKGFSGRFTGTKRKLKKYHGLNRLTLCGVWFALEAFQDDPPELIPFENVPRIASREWDLLHEIIALLRANVRSKYSAKIE